MKKWLMAVIFASVLALAACGGGDGGETEDPADTGTDTEQPAEDTTDEDATDGDADEGDSTVDASAAEEVYKQSCASCHAADLSGGAGPDLTAVGADYSADEIEDIINNGIGTMPAGLVPADDATLLANWLADMK